MFVWLSSITMPKHESSDSFSSSSSEEGESLENSSSSSEEGESSAEDEFRSVEYSRRKVRRQTGMQDTGGRSGSWNNSFGARRDAGAYVLRSRETNICYVGKSENVGQRIIQHQRENSRDVLNRESLLTTGSVDDLESWERNEVLTRMYREGMESVRGWRYTRRGRLTADEMISARNDIVEKFDLCRRCGRNSHFADRCFARSPAYWCKDIPM